MTTRHLDALFDPRSVAVIGASERPGRVGTVAWRNLLAGGFKGAVHAVNLKHDRLGDHPVHRRIAHCPPRVDLALVCTPAASVPGVVAELAAAGVRAATLLTPGLNPELVDAARRAARPSVLRLLGPDSIGSLSPHLGLNASVAPLGAAPGPLAFVSQSAGLVTAVLDWAAPRKLGFSHVVSLGKRADIDFGDLLDHLASDPRTRAILLYMEATEAPRKFMSAARAASRNKPVIVVKAGRTESGQRAAQWHTRSLAGSDLVFDAAISRAGMLRVDTLRDLFMAAETLARFRGSADERLTVLTNGGGAGVLAADAADAAGVELAPLGADTIARFTEWLPGFHAGQPIDLGDDAPASLCADVARVLANDPEAGATLFIHVPSAQVPGMDVAEALLPGGLRTPPRLLSCWLGEAAAAPARDRFRSAGLPTYFTPEEGVRAFAMGVRYRRNQEQLLEAPPARDLAQPADVDTARRLVRTAIDAGRDVLTEPEAKALLAAYGVPVVAPRLVPADPAAAEAAALELGGSTVLKVVSRDIAHKTDVGGVVLNLKGPAAVRQAAEAMLARLALEHPEAHIEGLSVQPMVQRAHSNEVIVGASIDPTFGPVILFGAGGTAVELVADRAVGLPPLNDPLARALMERTRVSRLLKGWRERPAADEGAVRRVLVAVSQMLADLPELVELDINPLLVNHQGVVALDARVRVDRAAGGGEARFAICPYPAALVEHVAWQGRALTLRPIRPEDEQQHREFVMKLDPEDIRRRLFQSRRSFERSELARFTQIDYSREMAFIATAPPVAAAAGDPPEETLGVVRVMTDPDNERAEFAIVIRSDLKGKGLGRVLMTKLLGHLRDQRTVWLDATVLRENRPMRAFMRKLGFIEAPLEPGDDTVEVHLRLRPDEAPSAT